MIRFHYQMLLSQPVNLSQHKHGYNSFYKHSWWQLLGVEHKNKVLSLSTNKWENMTSSDFNICQHEVIMVSNFGFKGGCQQWCHFSMFCYSPVSQLGKIRLLDVGSCFNPFLKFDEFLTVGIDIVPAVEVQVSLKRLCSLWLLFTACF